MVNQLPIGVTYSHVVAKSIRENQIEDKNFINVRPFTSFYGEWTTQKKTQTFFYTPNNY